MYAAVLAAPFGSRGSVPMAAPKSTTFFVPLAEDSGGPRRGHGLLSPDRKASTRTVTPTKSPTKQKARQRSIFGGLRGMEPDPCVVMTPMSTELSTAEEAKLFNKNRVSHYGWCSNLLESIAANSALEVADADTSARGTPLFVVAGACPSYPFASMQAVMYSLMRSPPRPGTSSPPPPPLLDFWWIKPTKADPLALEPATLTRTTKGQYKNDPGRSRPLYAQFADLFVAASSGAGAGGSRSASGGSGGSSSSSGEGDGRGAATPAAKAASSGGGSGSSSGALPGAATEWQFGWAEVGGSTRATLTSLSSGIIVYLTFVWQERWSSILARSRYMEGKVVYQKDPTTAAYHARQYLVSDGKLTLHPAEQRVPGDKALCPDTLKRLFPMAASAELTALETTPRTIVPETNLQVV